MNLPSVILADDDPTVLEAVSRMLLPDFEIVATVRDGASLVAETRRLNPDVMIVDLFMPGLSGFEAIRELKKQHFEGRAIFLTLYDDSSFVEEARALGAMGYVLKSSADRDLLPAIREALQGHFFQSPSLRNH
ncbi:MAG TPA: response regulator transcription factor [Terriglobia bacterium]|nr:response regulator transcription factor [Terriglobia bacterium]